MKQSPRNTALGPLAQIRRTSLQVTQVNSVILCVSLLNFIDDFSTPIRFL